jgi:tRNA (uracil-5-)-methyltransferase TRM9
MQATVAAQLVALNRQFYAAFGAEFSATRGRIQPGVRQIISQLQGAERMLDLGCGNGELARTLAQTGFRGEYLGLDFSLPLLKDAAAQSGAFPVHFLAVDLTADDWPPITGHWSLITAFAALHHIPGAAARLGILQKVHALLAPEGKFIHSEWQFLNSPKLAARIQPWERVNLSAAEVDEGDYLLDWRSGGLGLRYVHHFSEEELSQLASAVGFRVEASFLSDGSNGRLGLYQVWSKI